ncbi:major facilitator superfamily transporter [Dissoconium aciculare CBS 342.82]|uniref:Major facilitator superfamily transporter n=1 Tax=Dissoconium aciculare CBS 342.82 TaxID=1314786 RepID=A0A6J3M3Z4_9PEZI|nr:major facilitator superfamily transporter [Dissoconium aciculare CBS 342.82]KAF1822204.1 major facilitator superfamily transporter [Dissoconium aciculare CBS 342.82]
MAAMGLGAMDKNELARIETAEGSFQDRNSGQDENTFNLEHAATFQTTFDPVAEGKLYQDGQLIVMPAATRDPKDPMNLPLNRRILGVFCLSFFGALAASAEIILGACLPVFALEYAGIDPAKYILAITPFPIGFNPLATLNMFPNAAPIFEVYLLGALPLLMIGVCNLFFIPLAISMGRRPVLLITGLIALGGIVWAGESRSLQSHIAARCVQAVGAGTVESLIPFIIQDMIPVHQRNTWISAAFAAQGVIIIAVGFAAPTIIVHLSWRWVYFVTAIAGAVFLVGVFLFMPETRWPRTRAEMNGIPRDDANIEYTPRTWKLDLAVKVGKTDWKKGWNAFVDTLRVFFYPQVFFVTMFNGAMISSAFSASYVAAPALLTSPWAWNFLNLGYSLVAVLVAALLVGFVTGGLADVLANSVAKKRGTRVPENQLINLILPGILGILGTVLFGIAGNDPQKYHWIVFLLGLGFMAFGFLGTSAIGTVYVLECYPHLAGPALVSIASFRFIIAFLLTLYGVDFILWYGYAVTFAGIYGSIIAGFMLLLPLVYIYGPAWRRRWPATKYGDQ